MNLYAACAVINNCGKYSILTIAILAKSDAEAKGIIYERCKDKCPGGEIYGIQTLQIKQEYIDAAASKPNTDDALVNASERAAFERDLVSQPSIKEEINDQIRYAKSH